MIGVIAELPVKEGEMEEAVRIIRELMNHVAQEEGTLSYTLNRHQTDPNRIVIMERYKDRDALEAHSSTPQFRAFLKEIGSLLSGKPQIRVMEEIHSIR